MTLISPSRPNPYTGSPLDRAAHRRDDDSWIAAQLDQPSTRYLPVWRAKTLITDPPANRLLDAEAARPLRDAATASAFLGLLDGQPLFAIDASALDDPAPLLPAAARFEDLRAIPGLLPSADAAIAAHARGLMHWRARHRFCGNCGAPCEPRSAGNAMACPNCGAQHFPRTDPAVIMLVHRGDRALLAHSQRFPNSQMFSTLAGFVEPGESLEEAVAREVMEEVAVPVARVRYHSSQPWPFPASIMLGFYAEGLADPITPQQDEIADARWFSRADLRDPASVGITLPRPDSIARRLIEDWLASP